MVIFFLLIGMLIGACLQALINYLIQEYRMNNILDEMSENSLYTGE